MLILASSFLCIFLAPSFVRVLSALKGNFTLTQGGFWLLVSGVGFLGEERVV